MWVLVGAVSNVLKVPFASLANTQRLALCQWSKFLSLKYGNLVEKMSDVSVRGNCLVPEGLETASR